MKAIITLLLALVSFASHADESQWSMQLHGASWPSDDRSKYDDSGRDWNEVNLGIGLRYELSPVWAVQAGVYHNSVDKTSAYVIGDWLPMQAGSFKLGLFVGGVTGYSAYAVTPAGGVVARHEFGKFSATWRAMPPIPKRTPLTVGFEIGIKL
jgi:hypothetical protein